MIVLVLNCGSSSLKYQVLDMKNESEFSLLAKGLVERIGLEMGDITHSVTGKEKHKVHQPIPTHTEGIKGAEATAVAIFLARRGKSKEEIKAYIETELGYDLSRTCDEIRPDYYHVESCMETVPEAITAFLEGDSFEDVIRTAVSLGGDCDTLTAIAGSIAEGFYGVPEELKKECHSRLTEEMNVVLKRFEERRMHYGK